MVRIPAFTGVSVIAASAALLVGGAASGTVAGIEAKPPPRICAKFASVKTGSDRSPGTKQRPFKTPQRLHNALRPGQTGCLRGGLYPEQWQYVLDLWKSDVTIMSAPGERATLAGIVVVRSGSHNARLKNVIVDGTGRSNTIQVYGTDFVLERSDVTNGWHGLSCIILGDRSAGTAVRPVIRGNRFHECGNRDNGANDHGIYASHVEGGLITENVFWNISAYAVQLYPSAQRMVFSHNVVDGAGSVRGGVIFGGESGTPSSNNTVEYNVISYAVTYNIESWWGGMPGSGNLARSNCLYGGGRGEVHDMGGFSESGNVVRSPQFVNRAAHDYRLRGGSGCAHVVGYDAISRVTAGR